MEHQEFRTHVLASYGASVSEIDELLAYNQNVFYQKTVPNCITLPLLPETHIAVWQEYATIAQAIGAFDTLKTRLVQLQFPVQAGISETDAYRKATRKGIVIEQLSETSRLQLRQPEQLQLLMHQSLAGVIPVLFTPDRTDFVTLVQALSRRNEPVPVPDSMGACIVNGFNNWDRIWRYRQQWEAKHPEHNSDAAWSAEFQRIIPQKHLYQDRFILLSDGFYSAVSPDDLQLSDTEWWQHSQTIRLEHECTHYLTYRLFQSMRNNILDELIADYQGIIAATGRYRADWFLRFLGLEAFPLYREGGRLQNYKGNPPLSDGAFQRLQQLIKAAAEHLEQFDADYRPMLMSPVNRILTVIGLTCLTLEELASPDGSDRIYKTFSTIQASIKPNSQMQV